MTLAFCFHLPKLDKMVACEYRDLPEPVKLPGCMPVYGRDFAVPVQDRSHNAYKKLLENVTRFNSSKGIIVNSFLDSKEGAIKALQVEEPGKPPVYPIGPLVQTGSSDRSGRPECLKWLDDQPTKQTPTVSCQKGSRPGKEPKDKAWLSCHGPHKSRCSVIIPPVAGFLTHCGWNSTLESIVHGMPLIAWPLNAEEKMNAVMLNEGLNVALRPKMNESGIVGREEIARVVNALMEGEEGKKVRQKMKGLKETDRKVLSEDGSSTKSTI
ncbi:hypothetical protein RHGRI_019308 [Rhododendron griersonianum]|uniref:Uncharacterized protein n=1 Tax=Rhododendron griersonianum TaxID=479676 RepID=A0AAV6JFV2_9ERIC|nr:hypothetical protein RHGRI_019308 [Rhododendron griersonianum]